ncbi:T9SS type A sorting domain-containing protein [Psychroserpens mesophilus]|uniref:T9SS type A sorting domain-containing protein n=1 Tax=Psychroserpens mesophilus TaxID=325473 RepID=UPI003D6543A9
MKRILLLMLLSLTTAIAMAQTTWTGLGTNTNWNNTDNWDTNLVPTASDDVIIPTGFTVTLNSVGTVKSIDVQGNAVFDIDNSFTFAEPSTFGSNTTINWSAGSLRGNGIILTNSGVMNIDGTNVTLALGTILNNDGFINFTTSGNIFIAADAVLNNTVTGILDFQADNSGISESGVGTNLLNNSGLIKTSFVTSDPDDQATISVEFKNNDGTVQVENGTLNLSNGTVDSIELQDGTYNVFANATLEWDNDVTVSGTLTGNLVGNIVWRDLVRVNAADTATFDFTGNETITWVSGSLDGGGTLFNKNKIAVQTSNVFINGITTLNNSGEINFESGGDIFIQNDSALINSLTGIIDFQADNSGISESGAGTNLLNNSGLIKTSFVTSNPDDQATISVELKNNDGTIQVEKGILNLSNGTVDSIELQDGIYNVFTNATLEWDNDVTVSGTLTGNLEGNIVWRDAVRVNVADTATFDFTGNETLIWASGNLDGGGTLFNKNKIAVQTSNVFIYGSTTLNNSGEINFEGAGDIFIQNDSVLNNSLTGTIDFQADNSGISESGAGINLLSNFGLIKTSFVTADPTDQATINVELKNNNGTIQVEEGILNLSNGVVDAIELTDGIYNVFSGANLDWDVSVTLSGTLTGNLQGTLNWRSTVRVNSPDTAIFDFSGNETITWVSGSLDGGGILINENKIAVQTSNVFINGITTLNNNEEINFESGGDIFIQNDSVLNNSLTGTIDFQADNSGISETGVGINLLNNEGLLICSSSNSTVINVEVINTGTIEAAFGTLNFSGVLDHQAGGIIKGISIFNMPTITNFTNNGTIAPGASPGTLTVIGNYISTGNTILDIELNGLIPDTEHDVLVITGTNVVFEGMVNVTMGFEGTIGDEFTIATTSGTIATENLQSPIENVDFDGKRYTFDISYPDNNKVVLTITDKLDILPPNIITQDITVQLDASGNVSIADTDVDNGTTDNCTPTNELQFSLDTTVFTCADLGDNIVTLTVTDNDGNFAEAQAIVTVEDVTNPNVVTQNITVQLEASGNVSVLPSDIDDGSNDNCSVANLSLDVSDFTCANLGANTVNLTVTDQSGNSDSASALVTVQDAINPTAITQNITVQLDASGNASILPSDIDDGSNDNCSVANLSLDVSDFTCANLGANTVNLTVTDQSGNSDSASALVTVQDAINPTAIAQNITVQLDASGNASVLPSEIDNGSNDNCSVTGLSLDITDFTCADLGDNTVKLTVIDQSGNEDSATIIVTVEDNIAPVVNCPSGFTVETTGDFILPDYFVEGTVAASDNCGFTVQQTPAPGTILPDGDYLISIEVTDDFENIESCSFNLKVDDTTLGVDDFQLSDHNIIVYPNPVLSTLNIKNTSQLKLINLEIIDVTGKLVNTIDLKPMNETMQVSLEGYANGMYFVRIYTSNNSITKRIIKQ